MLGAFSLSYQSSKNCMNYIRNHENTESQRGDINIDNQSHLYSIHLKEIKYMYIRPLIQEPVLFLLQYPPRASFPESIFWPINGTSPPFPQGFPVTHWLQHSFHLSPRVNRTTSLCHTRSPCSLLYLIYWFLVPDIHFLFTWPEMHVFRLLILGLLV